MKRIKKLAPVQTYDIAAMEHWLETMAGEGLSAVEFGLAFVHFEKSDPKPNRRYRLDANPKFYGSEFYDNPEPEIVELYKQAGWHFAGQLWGKSFFVYYTDDPGAVEPYTDPQSRALSLETLVKSCKNITILIFFATFIATFSMFYRLVYSPRPLYPIAAILLLVWLGNLFRTFHELRAIRRMKQWLEDGRTLKEFQFSKSWPLLSWAYWIFFLFAVIAALLE